jgi:hypothetical protein
MLIAKNAGAAIVSPTLAGITAKAAFAFAGQVGLEAAISGKVTSLAEEVLRTTRGKIARLLAIGALLVLIAAMSGILAQEVLDILKEGGVWGCEIPAKADPQK